MPQKVNKRVGRGARPTPVRVPRAPGNTPVVRKEPAPSIKLPEELEATRSARWEIWRKRAAGYGTGSILEFICWEWLTLKKKQVPDVDFIYQYPLLGGRTQFGGFVADFYFPVQRMVWNPAGLQFHQVNTKDRARDMLAKAQLAGKGVKLIFLWEDDLLQREEYTLQKAWKGEQIQRPV